MLLVHAATPLAVSAAPTNAGVIPPNANRNESAYVIIPDSLSPDGRYGIAMSKTIPESPSAAHNFLVAVKPFKLLTVLYGDGLYPESHRLAQQVEWTRDNSRVLVTTTHDKWDMIVGSSLVVLTSGTVARRVDLLEAINQRMLADFRRSGAEPYNDVLPFILTDSEIRFSKNGEVVEVETDAGNDPNTARNIEWTARFEGLYHVADGTWSDQKLKSESRPNSER